MEFAFIFFIIIIAVFIVIIVIFYNKKNISDKNNLPNKNKEIKPITKESERRYIKDVKPGETIQIEWSKIRGGIGHLKCLNNDPKTKKIFLEVNWSKEVNGLTKEKIILDYNSEELANFHLLNKVTEQNESSEDDFDIITLQKKMNEAIDKQEYEEAEKLQKKIDKLSRK